jgi:hypothetical protein
VGRKAAEIRRTGAGAEGRSCGSLSVKERDASARNGAEKEMEETDGETLPASRRRLPAFTLAHGPSAA